MHKYATENLTTLKIFIYPESGFSILINICRKVNLYQQEQFQAGCQESQGFSDNALTV